MNKIKFYKYHGTGNDFIMINAMQNSTDLSFLNRQKIADLCHRRFGIGADGLIVLAPSDTYDFKMIYFNSDGNESSMCGNGGRCLIKFAADLGHIQNSCTFVAIDGVHKGVVDSQISLKMGDVEKIEKYIEDFVIQTGSPHYIKFVEQVDGEHFVAEAKTIRHNRDFNEKGINVNFVELLDNSKIKVRTFERGVEDETYSCGTGVVGAALVSSWVNQDVQSPINIQTLGGTLSVSYEKDGSGYKNIWLKGPATYVFRGEIELG